MNKSNSRVVISARVNIRHLAEAALFLKQAGAPPEKRSKLIRESLKALSGAAKREGVIKGVSSNAEALSVLEDLGISFDESEQAKEDIDEALSLDSLKGGLEEEGKDWGKEVRHVLSNRDD